MADSLKCNVIGPFFGLRCSLDAGHGGPHVHLGQSGLPTGRITATWEPEPEKPREWLVVAGGSYGPCLQSTKGRGLDIGETVRVHDADQCDRLKPHQEKISISASHFEKMIKSYNGWKENAEGSAFQFLVLPYTRFEIRRFE